MDAYFHNGRQVRPLANVVRWIKRRINNPRYLPLDQWFSQIAVRPDGSAQLRTTVGNEEELMIDGELAELRLFANTRLLGRYTILDRRRPADLAGLRQASARRRGASRAA